MTSQHLLLVDDEDLTRSLLADCLRQQGFQVSEAADAAGMRRCLDQAEPIDLVLLDINLPGIDGLSLARELRLKSEIGIIMVTARESEADRVVGLELGADDYVVKGTSFLELLARIRAVLRRSQRPPGNGEEPVSGVAGEVLRFDGWMLESETRRFFDPEGGLVELTRGEFDMLAALVRARGRVLSREQLSEALGSHRDQREKFSNDRTIDVLIGRLRRKIGDQPRQPQRLVTVHGVGYRLEAETYGA